MKKFLPLAALALSFHACTKSGASGDQGKKDSTQQPEIAVPVDVYVGCTIGKVDSSQAGYWKDGVIYPVSEKHFAWYGISVFPVGSDVYVSGGEYNTSGYWKNGQFTPVVSVDYPLGVSLLAFSGNDRYQICGGAKGTGVTGGLYKNDQLQQPGIYSGIVTSGQDVFVFGSTPGSNGKAIAAIWKNGMLQELGQGTNASFVNGLAVSGGTTYACGYEQDPGGHAIAHYWKNGQDSVLSDASGITMPQNIAVSSGGNVYMSGYFQSGTFQHPGNDSRQLLWKNGAMIDWNVPANTLASYDLAVNGPDVYQVLGISTSDPETNKMVLWKNGTLTKIGEDSQHVSANHITLVKK